MGRRGGACGGPVSGEGRMTEKGDAVQDIKATVWIGKQGLTESVVGEVVLQLEKRHRVKVKWLRNADFDPRALADGASATLVMVRGRTAVLEEQKSDRTRHISSSRHG